MSTLRVEPDSCCSRYKIAMDEEVSKGRMHLIKNQLDALVYFYPKGLYIFIYMYVVK